MDIYYHFDFNSTKAQIFLIMDGEKTISIYSCDIGVKIPIGRTNQQELDDEKKQLGISTAVSTLGSSIAIGAGAYTGNSMMIASGVTGLTSTMANVASKLSTMHLKGNFDIPSSLDGLYSPQDAFIKRTYMKPLNYDYRAFKGNQYNKTANIGDIYGYIQIGDIHLDDLDATYQEKEDLMIILKNGFIKTK